jgi:hypothetical protein
MAPRHANIGRTGSAARFTSQDDTHIEPLRCQIPTGVAVPLVTPRTSIDMISGFAAQSVVHAVSTTSGNKRTRLSAMSSPIA